MATDNRGWFAAPAPVRELFKLFPLRVYGPEPLPARAPGSSSSGRSSGSSSRPALFIFASADAARDGAPSFNPSCLKWQTFLRIAGVDVDIVPSNNHASPSGALPFLLPPLSPPPSTSTPTSTSAAIARPPAPLTGEKILLYAHNHAPNPPPPPPSPRLEAYRALLFHGVRPAWLYALYLNPANDALLTSLYLPAAPLLRAPQRRALRAAATAEILNATRAPDDAAVDPARLYADAAAAFGALSALLGPGGDEDEDDNAWFFGANGPTLFDAEVFAYTWLVLGQGLEWGDDALGRCLEPHENLVRHRARLYERCWGRKED